MLLDNLLMIPQPKSSIHSLRKQILLAMVFCLLGLNAEAAKGPVMLNVDVAPGTWKAVRLNNLPKGAVVALEVKCDGDIRVLLIDSADYRRFPDTPRPLFLGRVEKKLSFSVTIPAGDSYYVVFDNASGREPREITLTVGAARGQMDQIEAANTILRLFEKQLHVLFSFEPFAISIAPCDHLKAFDAGSGMALCAGYIRRLYQVISDRKQAKNALSFSIFHELARILLAQWGHPRAMEKTAADELAAVIMIMLNQTETLSTHAEYFARNLHLAQKLAAALKDDRHPVTSQRAEKILVWVKNPEFVQRWQPFLVPHMQTLLLERLQQKPTPWTDLPLVEKELRLRSRTQAAREPSAFSRDA